MKGTPMMGTTTGTTTGMTPGTTNRVRRAAVIALGLCASGVAIAAAPPGPAAGSAAAKPAATTAKPATATTAARPGAAAAPAAPTDAAERARKTAEVLVAQGMDTLALGDIKAARDLFVDVLQIEPRNRRALEALGYCYIKLDDMPRATKAMEGAIVAPPAADPAQPNNKVPSRSLTINLAMSLLRSRNTVRAGNMLYEYLNAAPNAVDEEVLNALAVTLDQTSKEGRLSKVYQNLERFYMSADAKLEATRPGQKRWGVEWIPESEWAKKDASNKQTRLLMDDKGKELSKAQAKASAATAEYENAKARARRQRVPNLGQLQSDAVQASSRVDKLQAEYDALEAKLLRPTFPKMFAAVPIELPTAVASAAAPAAPAVPEPVAVATKPPEPAVVRPPQLSRGNGPADPPAADPTPPPVAVVTPPPPLPPPEPARRKVFTYAAGFAVTSDLMVTTAAAVDGATRVNVTPPSSAILEAEVVKVDAASGLALIKVKGGRVPYVGLADAFAGGQVSCASYPTPALFDPQPEEIAGSAAAPKDGWSVRLAKHPRLSGAPIFSGGKVVGVELASRENVPSSLPAATLAQVKAIVGNAALPAANLVDPKGYVCLISGVKEK